MTGKPRGVRADAQTDVNYVLAKHVSILRATYQIKLLTYLAVKSRRTLVIGVPPSTKIHHTLQSLIDQNPEVISIERFQSK